MSCSTTCPSCIRHYSYCGRTHHPVLCSLYWYALRGRPDWGLPPSPFTSCSGFPVRFLSWPLSKPGKLQEWQCKPWFGPVLLLLHFTLALCFPAFPGNVYSLPRPLRLISPIDEPISMRFAPPDFRSQPVPVGHISSRYASVSSGYIYWPAEPSLDRDWRDLS